MTEADICNQALGRIHAGSIISLEDTDTSPQSAACRTYYEHCLKELLISYDWNFALVTLFLNDRLNISERHEQRLAAIADWNNKHMGSEISDDLISELQNHYEKESHEYNYLYDLPSDLMRIVDIRHAGESLYRTTEHSDFEIGNSRFYGSDKTKEGSYIFDSSGSGGRWPDELVSGAIFQDRVPRTVIKSRYSGLTLQYVSYIEDTNLYPNNFTEVLVLNLALKLTIQFNNDKILFQGLLGLYNQALERAKIYDCRQVSMSYL